jgi:hypothetical protein
LDIRATGSQYTDWQGRCFGQIGVKVGTLFAEFWLRLNDAQTNKNRIFFGIVLGLH